MGFSVLHSLGGECTFVVRVTCSVWCLRFFVSPLRSRSESDSPQASYKPALMKQALRWSHMSLNTQSCAACSSTAWTLWATDSDLDSTHLNTELASGGSLSILQRILMRWQPQILMLSLVTPLVTPLATGAPRGACRSEHCHPRQLR